MTKTYSPEATALADAILKASGSNLKNYTTQLSRDAILTAAQSGIDSARTDLLELARRHRHLLSELHAGNAFSKEHLWQALTEADVAIAKAGAA